MAKSFHTIMIDKMEREFPEGSDVRAYHHSLDIWMDAEITGHSTGRVNNDYSAYVHVCYHDEEFTNDGLRSWDKVDIEEVRLK